MGKANALCLRHQPKESSLPIEAPGATFLYDLYPRFVVAVQEFIRNLSLGGFVSQLDCS